MKKLDKVHHTENLSEAALAGDAPPPLARGPHTSGDLFSVAKPKTSYRADSFQIQNRRYLGNKHKLLDYIEDIVAAKCGRIKSLCDIFAGTGVVGSRFNRPGTKIISNDILYSNFACLNAFLATTQDCQLASKIQYLNSLEGNGDNYFSHHFGETYFTRQNAEKIGAIREEIENIAENETDKSILICSLIYAVDKVANTVGHYDAYRKTLDMVKPIELLVPEIHWEANQDNEVHREDANELAKNISCDVLYVDPPYNSRQYSDAYHLLENLAEWKKPEVTGIGKKMDRTHIKSQYCLKDAATAFRNMIGNTDCKHILMSYNNTGESKDGRSNARISDTDILNTLKEKGSVEIFEKSHKLFTAGKSNGMGHTERVFYCKVGK